MSDTDHSAVKWLNPAVLFVAWASLLAAVVLLCVSDAILFRTTSEREGLTYFFAPYFALAFQTILLVIILVLRSFVRGISRWGSIAAGIAEGIYVANTVVSLAFITGGGSGRS